MVDIELGQEVVNALMTSKQQSFDQNSDSVRMKFDDKGTLHLRSYDADGKRLDDIAFRQEDAKPIAEKTYDETEVLRQRDVMHTQSTRKNVFLIVATVLLILATVGTVAVPFILRWLGV